MVVKDDVESDVLVAGGNVTVTGQVGGDVLVIGGNVQVAGQVIGNVRVLGGNVELAGSVGHNVSVVGGTLVLGKSSRVGGHVSAAVGSLKLEGTVEGSVQAAAGDAVVAGEVKGPVEVWLGRDGQLEVASTAVTGAGFTYHASRPATVGAGAKLAQVPELKPFVLTRDQGHVGWLISLFGSLALALVLVRLLPKKLMEVASEALAHPWSSLGKGALWAVVVPLAVIVMLLTLIGLPIALVLGAVYVVGVLVSKVVAGAAVGWWLKQRPQLKFMQSWSTLWLVLFGVTLFRLVTFIPIPGTLVGLVAMLWAWGALIEVQRRTLASFR